MRLFFMYDSHHSHKRLHQLRVGEEVSALHVPRNGERVADAQLSHSVMAPRVHLALPPPPAATAAAAAAAAAAEREA